MNLEYLDNIDYAGDREPSTDDLCAELAECLQNNPDAVEIYDILHGRILKEIKTSELAITVIMPDLLEIMDTSVNKALLVMRFLANPYASYTELGEQCGISKQRVAVILHGLARNHQWLAALLKLHNGET